MNAIDLLFERLTSSGRDHWEVIKEWRKEYLPNGDISSQTTNNLHEFEVSISIDMEPDHRGRKDRLRCSGRGYHIATIILLCLRMIAVNKGFEHLSKPI